jgi:hypothetical protein
VLKQGCGAADDGAAGFTVIEVLVAIALGVLVAFAGLAACSTVAAILRASSLAAGGADAIESAAAGLRSDAASAFAVFVPPRDAAGAPNAGRELDFYARAADGTPLFWRYVYDPQARSLQRTDYDAAGNAGVRDPATGVIDPRAAYPPLTGVTRFAAVAIDADALGDPAQNGYAGIGRLFAHPPHAYGVHFAGAGPDALGGNRIVAITLAGSAAARTIHLAAGVMPSGFTVGGAPLWHAVVYRVDQSHRFLLGPAGKSHVFIDARVDVSYDGWKTRTRWCQFNLLGNPDGLDPHDPHADYKPDEPIEQTDAILAACRRLYPQPPAPSAPDNPPDPGAVHAPLPNTR